MITDILCGKVLVESYGKPAGIYTFDDFSDEELQEERNNNWSIIWEKASKIRSYLRYGSHD